MADEHVDSIKTLFQALRDLADQCGKLDVRMRVAEERLARSEIYTDRMMADAISIKAITERTENKVDQRFIAIERNVFGLQKVLWVATGVLVTIQVILHFLSNFVYLRH